MQFRDEDPFPLDNGGTEAFGVMKQAADNAYEVDQLRREVYSQATPVFRALRAASESIYGPYGLVRAPKLKKPLSLYPPRREMCAARWNALRLALDNWHAATSELFTALEGIYGRRRSRGQPPKREQVMCIAVRVDAGFTDSEIATELGLSVEAVAQRRKWLRKNPGRLPGNEKK